MPGFDFERFLEVKNACKIIRTYIGLNWQTTFSGGSFDTPDRSVAYIFTNASD